MLISAENDSASSGVGIIEFEKHEKSPELLEAEEVAAKQKRLREVEA